MTSSPQVEAEATLVERRRYLGTVGDVDVGVAIDDAPWTLPIDMLVVSVSAVGGLGQLGAAVLRALPAITLSDVDLAAVSPKTPRIVVVPSDDGQSSRLRHLALASAREAVQQSPSRPEPPASLNAVRQATAAVIELARAHNVGSLGLPLLAAGAIGFPVSDVAFEVVPVVRSMLQQVRSGDSSTLSSLTFVCRDTSTSRAIERVWKYYEMLRDVRTEALTDAAVVDGTARAGLTQTELKSALNLPEEELWRPCQSELAQLRHTDRELDDVRATLVGSLEMEYDALRLQGLHQSADHTRRRRTPSGQKLLDHLSALDQDIHDVLNSDHRWRQLSELRLNHLAALRTALMQQSVLPRLLEAVNMRLEELRRRSHDSRRSEFTRRLNGVDTTRLREEPKPGGLETTAAQEHLMALTDPTRFPRATIGVAGPRGSGKSALLREITNTWHLRTHQFRAVSIFMSAPASYASRDFLVQLYSEICESVLASDPEQRIRVEGSSRPPTRLRSTSLIRLVLAPALVLVAGIGAFAASPLWRQGPEELRVAGVAVAVAAAVPILFRMVPMGRLDHFSSDSTGSSANGQLVIPPTRRHPVDVSNLLVAAAMSGLIVVAASTGIISVRHAAGVILLATVVVLLVPRIRRRTREDDLILATVPDQAPGSPYPGTATRGATDREPADAFLRATAWRAAFLAVTAAEATMSVAGLMLLTLDAATAPVDGWLLLGAVLTSAASAALVPGLRWHAELVDHVDTRDAAPADPHSFTARRHLRKMLFQRSVSSGWTSAVKLASSRILPLGVETGATGTTTEAEVPLSVPEIVAGIRGLLPARGPAVLAIDELDKMESIDDARKFLNEIKGIFGADKTRILVSMSEDAIARFERRGLPFRDVFDSAFDEVVRVPYLSAAQAHSLLNKRVTGVPEPLLALAFCQSGGLPRDLLRATQQLIEVAPHVGGTVPDIVREAVHADMTGKIAAVTAAMRSISVEPDVSTLLQWVHAVDTCRPRGLRSAPCLLDDGWLTPLGSSRPISTSGGDSAPERKELLRLGVELVGYLYYCRTLMELFCAETDDQIDRLIRLVDRDDGRGLDYLAQTRQTFAVNPFVAWRQLNNARTATELPEWPLPPPFEVSLEADDRSDRSRTRVRPRTRIRSGALRGADTSGNGGASLKRVTTTNNRDPSAGVPAQHGRGAG